MFELGLNLRPEGNSFVRVLESLVDVSRNEIKGNFETRWRLCVSVSQFYIIATEEKTNKPIERAILFHTCQCSPHWYYKDK